MKISDIKKGQRFWEVDGSRYALFEAIDNAHEVHDAEHGKSGWEVHGKYIRGWVPPFSCNGIVEFFEAFKAGGYRLDLRPEV